MKHLKLVVQKPKYGWWSLLPLLIIIYAILHWSAIGARMSISDLAAGLPWVADFLSRMLPPNLSYITESLIEPAIQTVQIALWGTVLAVLIAIPLCFLAAKNISPNAVVYQFTRQTLNIFRGINELILALIFVAAVGLGPFAGVLALALHGAGMVGKFFAEAIEEMDQGPVEAMRASGCSKLQVIIFAVIPQVFPAWISIILYRLEANIRTSAVLGMIGAGGIGFELMTSMKMFEYGDTAACVLVILGLVFITDIMSSKLRQAIR